jgi:solute carrier family 13 (sodium-dependent dicarboxylate transporter), member 2/3/5
MQTEQRTQTVSPSRGEDHSGHGPSIPGESDDGILWLRWTGLIAGPILALLTFYVLDGITASNGEALTREGRATLAAAVLMAVWWLSEAMPIEATALVPIGLFPILDIATIQGATRPYASEVIYLFLGGMMLGLAMEKWGLHKRVALHVMSRVGTSPPMLILGVMTATAFLSLWVSNTAAAVMMLPIGMSIVGVVESAKADARGNSGSRTASGSAFATALMLGIAYAATIGGVGTLIGTPPNAVLAGFIDRRYGYELGFAEWLRIGLPFLLIFLPVTWFVLTRVAFRVRGSSNPQVAGVIRSQLAGLGRLSRGEGLTLVVFACAALAWMFRVPMCHAIGLVHADGSPRLADSGIAIIAAVAMFLIPVSLAKGGAAGESAANAGAKANTAPSFILNWRDATRLPWGVLLLFGGGLTLADALTAHNVDDFIGSLFAGLKGVHPLLLVLIMSTIVVFATEIGSNTAIATTFLPVAAAAATTLGVHPFLLCLPVAVGCSYAFMMPMGTPPNSLVFASGRVNIRQMARAGFVLNILSIITITLVVYFLAPALLNFDRTATLPARDAVQTP